MTSSYSRAALRRPPPSWRHVGRRHCVWTARSATRMRCIWPCSSEFANGLAISICCTFISIIIPFPCFPASRHHSSPRCMAGSICRDQAIWIAKRCGVPLKIAAKVDAVDRDYFESEIRKLLAPPDVEYIGEISDGEKSSFLSGAIALLAPTAWPEPFGLVFIEAMACGTPVIAFNRGAAPEIVEDGLSGFVVESSDEAVAATGRLSRLSRAAIRRRFEERFTARSMARDYLAVYRMLMDKALLPAVASANRAA